MAAGAPGLARHVRVPGHRAERGHGHHLRPPHRLEGAPGLSHPVQYPVPWDSVFGLTPHLARGTRENIDQFTRRIVERLPAPPRFEGLPSIPSSGPFILAANHYQRKGLWILHTAAVLTQAVAARQGPPVEDPPVRWMVTANWPPWRLGPFSIPSPGDRLLPKVAEALHCYPVSFAGSNPAFTAQSVRRILRDLKSAPRPIGIFPEGVAGSAGVLTAPLPGVDRLLAHLGKAGLALVPCRVHEEGRALVVRFGEAVPGSRLATVPDAAALAMDRIASLLG